MDIVEALPTLHPTVARVTLYRLRRGMPEYADATPEEREEILQNAVAAVAAQFPADAFEAHLAVQFVTADAMALECFHQAYEPGCDDAKAKGLRAQAASLLREAKGALRILHRNQAAREKAGGHGYYHHHVPPPVPQATPSPPAEPGQRTYEQMDPAEQYAAVYPKRAALIRAHGGLPPNVDFGPPEPDLVAAIVTSTSPMLLDLDEPQPAAA